MKQEFVASEKQQKEIEKAGRAKQQGRDEKAREERASIRKRTKAADEQEAEAQTALQNQAERAFE